MATGSPVAIVIARITLEAMILETYELKKYVFKARVK